MTKPKKHYKNTQKAFSIKFRPYISTSYSEFINVTNKLKYNVDMPQNIFIPVVDLAILDYANFVNKMTNKTSNILKGHISNSEYVFDLQSVTMFMGKHC